MILLWIAAEVPSLSEVLRWPIGNTLPELQYECYCFTWCKPLFVLLLEPSVEATPTREHWIRMPRPTQIKGHLVPVYPAINVHQLNGGATSVPKFDFNGQLRLQTIHPVTFYFAGVAAGCKGDEANDYCVCIQEVRLQIRIQRITSIENASSLFIRILQSNFVTVSYTAKQSGLVTMNLFTLNGQFVPQTTARSAVRPTYWNNPVIWMRFLQGVYMFANNRWWILRKSRK